MKILKAVAAEQFKSKYSYDFQRDDPKPSNVADDATLNIGSVENICSIRDANEISSFVNSILLKYLQFFVLSTKLTSSIAPLNLHGREVSTGMICHCMVKLDYYRIR